jgi:hypothetical protein
MRRFKLLEPLVFGGGTMLRLCHEMNRYSADLDFWFAKQISQEDYFSRFKDAFSGVYEITDSQIKHYTLLFELRNASYPKRLKIEIRREMKAFDFQEKIVFSKFSNKQIVVRAFTLDQAMQNKTNAFLDRGEIRDAYDVEFLLRKGIPFPPFPLAEVAEFEEKIDSLKEIDFKVKLGSILESDVRKYYTTRRFEYLKEKLRAVREQASAAKR